MTNSIARILSLYGFETRHNGSQWWGTGSIARGQAVVVTALGNDLYKVEHHRWFWDGGDHEVDERSTTVLHGAVMLQHLFERLPLWR